MRDEGPGEAQVRLISDEAWLGEMSLPSVSYCRDDYASVIDIAFALRRPRGCSSRSIVASAFGNAASGEYCCLGVIRVLPRVMSAAVMST